jgi:hypothetical protein
MDTLLWTNLSRFFPAVVTVELIRGSKPAELRDAKLNGRFQFPNGDTVNRSHRRSNLRILRADNGGLHLSL